MSPQAITGAQVTLAQAANAWARVSLGLRIRVVAAMHEQVGHLVVRLSEALQMSAPLEAAHPVVPFDLDVDQVLHSTGLDDPITSRRKMWPDRRGAFGGSTHAAIASSVLPQRQATAPT